MKWSLAILILLHGLIHFMGVAKSFGLAEMPRLVEPISTRAGIWWLLAGVGLVVSSVLFLTAPSVWWMFGLASVVASQIVILGAWSDAKVGTVANLIVLLLALYGLASQGPWSLRAEYRRAVQERLAGPRPSALVQSAITEEDLSALPLPVQRYVRQAGAVGQARVGHYRARWTGRIRANPDEPWMDFVAEQHNFIDRPARFFIMDARKAGLPVDVLHVFRGGSASMTVRLLSVVPLVTSAGPELTRAETVTLLNDLAILAPGALVEPAIRWEEVDSLTARAEYTVGSNTIGARLSFKTNGELADFVSDDRLAASDDGREFIRQRWSTPLANYRTFGPWRVATQGEGWWHPSDAPEFAYIELRLVELEVNPDT